MISAGIYLLIFAISLLGGLAIGLLFVGLFWLIGKIKNRNKKLKYEMKEIDGGNINTNEKEVKETDERKFREFREFEKLRRDAGIRKTRESTSNSTTGNSDVEKSTQSQGYGNLQERLNSDIGIHNDRSGEADGESREDRPKRKISRPKFE